MMKLMDLYQSIALTEEIAMEHYNKLNGQFDYNLPGVCNHYFAKYDGNNERTGEIVLTCRVAKTVKGQVRSTYQIDGKRIAKKHIDWKFLQLGGCQ